MSLTRTSARFRFVRPRLVLFTALLALTAPGRPLSASADPPDFYDVETPFVRVGLMRFASASTLTLTATPGARLLGPEGQERAAGTGPWIITLAGSGTQVCDGKGRRLGKADTGAVWRLQSEDTDTLLGIATPGNRPRHYRGCLEIRAIGGRLRVINELTLETYLRGVVASEMGTDAPLEALKAQAVAARTFALKSLGKWAADGYDVRDTTDSQVYGGAEMEFSATDRALRETAGLILTSAGQPIWATFCADCGGVTTPGATPDECPRSVVDTDAHARADASSHPSQVWTLTYTPERLAALLSKVPPSKKDPQPPSFGTLDNIKVVATDTSGRVCRLRLTWNRDEGRGMRDEEGTEGERKKEKGESPPPTAHRPVFVSEIGGNTLRTLLGLDTLRSTLFTVRRAPTGEFLFEGRGWGHGRGLCQRGAIALASDHDFQAILMRYYAGATLSRIRYGEGEDGEQGVGYRVLGVGKQGAAGVKELIQRPNYPTTQLPNYPTPYFRREAPHGG